MQYLRIFTVINLTLFGFKYHGCFINTGLIALLWSRATATTPFCNVDNFDSQVKNLLRNEMLTSVEMANFSNVFYDLQATLQTIWPGAYNFKSSSIRCPA